MMGNQQVTVYCPFSSKDEKDQIWKEIRREFQDKAKIWKEGNFVVYRYKDLAS